MSFEVATITQSYNNQKRKQEEILIFSPPNAHCTADLKKLEK